MIKKETFTKSWLEELNDKSIWKRQNNQLTNLEKACVALYLLESLKKAGGEFIFKGGTAVILLLNKIYRFSVDVDIIFLDGDRDRSILFNQICKDSLIFTHWDIKEREKREKNTDHFRFYYDSPTLDDEGYILLDAYLGENPYEKTCTTAVASDLLLQEGNPIEVITPTINGLLGDKLTAFAPKTIGIPIEAEPGFRPKRVEVLKQLYDLGNLFDECDDVREVTLTYQKVAKKEVEMQTLGYSIEEIVEDTLSYAFLIAREGYGEEEKFMQLQKGYNEFSKFVADLHFTQDDAALAAGKVAYLLFLISNQHEGKPNFFAEGIDMTEWIISGKENARINDYKYTSPAAFYYWFKAIGKIK